MPEQTNSKRPSVCSILGHLKFKVDHYPVLGSVLIWLFASMTLGWVCLSGSIAEAASPPFGIVYFTRGYGRLKPCRYGITPLAARAYLFGKDHLRNVFCLASLLCWLSSSLCLSACTKPWRICRLFRDRSEMSPPIYGRCFFIGRPLRQEAV